MQIETLGNLNNPRVLVVGVFHGDEPQGEYLINSYYEKFKQTNLMFIPRLNFSDTRVNCNGVDLNRNFPTKNWVLSEKNDYFGGEEPASEKETQFVIELIEKYDFQVILTLHAPYKIVNYDGGDDTKVFNIVNGIARIMGYPVEASIGYPTPGSCGTWAGVEKGILTITLELDDSVEVKVLEPNVFDVFKFLESIG